MKYHITFVLVLFLLLGGKAFAITDNYVEVAYEGTTATVSVAPNISSYVAVSSGTSSHVTIVQSPLVDVNVGEIYYKLSGTSADGEFYLEGSYKATVILNGLTLTNPSGPAINIQNGKRIDVSISNGTTSTLVDGSNDDYNGCFHSKGHTKFKGKGTLNVTGNSRHAIYSKEYVEVKNCTINVKGAVKDGIHCQQYFLLESGNVNVQNTQDDGIQVELRDSVSTGEISGHEDAVTGDAEDSGNFYQDGGVLTISSYGGKAIKTYGTITYNGGTQNFDTADTEINAVSSGVESLDFSHSANRDSMIYDLQGRHIEASQLRRGIYIVNGKKVMVNQSF